MVGNDRDTLAKMHEAAHAIHITDTIQAFLDIAANKNVTREERLNDANDTTTRRTLNSQTGMKNLQAKIPLQTSSHDMLMLRLRARAIPSHRALRLRSIGKRRLRRETSGFDAFQVCDCRYKYRHKTRPGLNNTLQPVSRDVVIEPRFVPL